MPAVLSSKFVQLFSIRTRSVIWCLTICSLSTGLMRNAQAQQEEPLSLGSLQSAMIGTWVDEQVPRSDPDAVYKFQTGFTFPKSGSGEPWSLLVSAKDVKGEIIKGDRLLLAGYSNPAKNQVTYRVYAMTPPAERLVTELSGLPAEAKEETCCGQPVITICAAQLSRSEDLAARIIAETGLVSWAPCAKIQAAKNIPLETLQKLAGDEKLGRRVQETITLLLASKSPADPADLIRMIHRLRDSSDVPPNLRDRTLSQAYLTALREKGIPTFLKDEKWKEPRSRRQLAHLAIDELEKARLPLDREAVMTFCDESLKLRVERVDAILTLERAKLWEAAPRLKKIFRDGPFFKDAGSSSITVRAYITQFVLTWRDSVDPDSASYREAMKTLDEFERIDSKAVELAKSNYQPPAKEGKGC